MGRRTSRRRGDTSVHGVLAVDKPSGPTSFDIVRGVRRLSGVARVGHAGTLDPMASGLLLVCLGEGTKAVPWLMDAPKRYRATVRLGVTTDTYDAEGEVVATAELPLVTETEVHALLGRFRGRVTQVPPRFSALKQDGRRLCDRVRAGESVATEPREVDVYSLDLVCYAPPALDLDVRCGKGFYVRSLAHDLGAALGCGGHLTALRRTEGAGIGVDGAFPFEALMSGAVPWRDVLVETNDALVHLPVVLLTEDEAVRIGYGNAVPRSEPPEGSEALSPLRFVAPDGRLLAVGEWRPGGEGGGFLAVLRGWVTASS